MQRKIPSALLLWGQLDEGLDRLVQVRKWLPWKS